jgi:hypothetical protein
MGVAVDCDVIAGSRNERCEGAGRCTSALFSTVIGAYFTKQLGEANDLKYQMLILMDEFIAEGLVGEWAKRNRSLKAMASRISASCRAVRSCAATMAKMTRRTSSPSTGARSRLPKV